MSKRATANLRVAGIVLLMLSLTCFALSRRFAIVPAHASTLALDELKDGIGLSFRDVTLLGQYAYTKGNGGPSAHHCALSFDTADGKKAVASLEVFPDGPFYETMQALEGGAIAEKHPLTFCATATALPMELTDYLQDFVKRNYGPFTPYRAVPLELIWAGDTEADYAAKMSGERGFYLRCAAACGAPGAAAILLSFLKRRKRNHPQGG